MAVIQMNYEMMSTTIDALGKAGADLAAMSERMEHLAGYIEQNFAGEAGDALSASIRQSLATSVQQLSEKLNERRNYALTEMMDTQNAERNIK